MRRALRVLGYIGLTLVGLVLVAYAVVYVASEYQLRRRFASEHTPFSVPRDSTLIAEGERLARIRGCTGCHGERAQGDTFVNDWMLARIVAPNLTQAVRRYSDEELNGIIRYGVRPDGSTLAVMPSGMFRPLNDHDLGAILVFLRSLPQSEGPGHFVRLGPLARIGLSTRQYFTAAYESDSAARLTSSYYAAPTDANAQGAYLARTVCSECHGLDLRGDKSGKPPDLRIAGVYPHDAFVTLMRTGKPPDGRDLGLMAEVARGRFSHFTDREIDALHAYLVARSKS